MKNQNYIDMHTHLHLMENPDNEIKKSMACGVKAFVCNATGQLDWGVVVGLCVRNSSVFWCLGAHPAKILNLSKEWKDELECLLVQNQHFLVGECGIDKRFPSVHLQEKILREHLYLGHKLNRSVHIHCFGLWDRLLYIFKSQGQDMPPKILLHSHHGEKDLISEFLKYNSFFSYSSIILPKDRAKVRSCVERVPLDRMLVESDCPDLAKTSLVLSDIVSEIGEIKKLDKDMVSKIIYQNSISFLRA